MDWRGAYDIEEWKQMVHGNVSSEVCEEWTNVSITLVVTMD